MSLRTGRLRRSDRLLQSRDFQRVARRGKRLSSSEFVVLIAASRSPLSDAESSPSGGGRLPRLGITTSRKVGNAVIRNRLRRRVREWFRRSRGELERAVDIVVIARPAAAALDGDEVAANLSHLLGVRGSECGA